MNRTIFKRFTTRTAICGGLAVAITVPLTTVWAQSNEGGFLMQLRIGERLVFTDTDSPEDTEDGTTTQAITDVDLSISSETRYESLKLDFGAGFRLFDTPTTDDLETDFTDPSLTLAYAQQTAANSFDIAVSATQTDLDDVSILDIATSSDGTLDQDFDDLTTDGGTRTNLRFDSSLTFRDDAPFGIGVDVIVNDISYTDLPAASTLTDYTYAQLRSTARFDISPVLRATLAARVEQTSLSGGGDGDARSYGIDAGAVLTQPNGTISFDLGLSDGDNGTQNTAHLGRSFATETTRAAFTLGLSQASSDDVFVTGSALFEHSFPEERRLSTFTANANRYLTSAGTSDEDIVTSLSANASYALSPQAALTLRGSFAESEDVDTGDTVTLSQANLSMRYDLNRDWTATAGLGVTARDPSDASTTTSTTLSLGVSRQFDLRR